MSLGFFKNTCFRTALIGFLGLSLIIFGYFKANAAQNGMTLEIDDNQIQGKKIFINARKMYYNAEVPVIEVAKALGQSKESFAKLPEGFDKCYWRANVAYLSGDMAEVLGDKQQAAYDFTESNELISKALVYNPNSSEANRVLADTIMRLMSYKGTMYMMTNAPHALKLLKKALDLDEKNYAAMNSLGMYYINAPAIGGGSVDKAIAVLQKALESKDQFDNLIANVWLGTAFQKKKDFSEAAQYCEKALQIFPNSPWAKELLQKIKLEYEVEG